jgi:error-prone DNA polymerase
MKPAYAELHCRSNFSFLRGASHPEELVQRAHALGYSALALTDECSLAGVVRAHAEAKAVGLPFIVGSEVKLSLPGDADAQPSFARLLLLATSRRGYGNLSEFITTARRRAPKGQYLALRADLEGKTPGVPYLAGLPDCLALLVAEPGMGFEALFAQAHWLATWFAGRAWLTVQRRLWACDDALQALVERVAGLTQLPVVATGDVQMHRRSRKRLHDTLTAIRLNTPVRGCGWALAPNAEQHLRPRERLAQWFPSDWLAETLVVAARCRFSLDELRYEYPEEIVPEGHTPSSWLRALVAQGVARRFGAQGCPEPVRASMEHELQIIAELKYEPYFLTVADIVHWARSQGILCQGRGSAANSVVCYCLGITEVDPARQTVLFERFISKERNEPPDIDVDFEHQRREEVIQYLYRKYGRHRAALAAAVVSYRPRSALRDVGKALEVPPAVVDALAKDQHWFDRNLRADALVEHAAQWAAQGLDLNTPREQRRMDLWLELARELVGFPRHLSQHTGGFVLARDHLARLVPVENAAMPDRSVIEWDKDDLDALGLLKVDVLALGMLSAIRRALAFVAFKQGQPFAMQDIPAEDEATYAMISRADTVGVFQVESRAQMSMLPRLRPRKFYDLVIEVAIVRPGPIQGGMVHPYLRRRNGQEPVDYPSGEVRQALERTLGVPIFQEQVMQLAILAADFSPGEADSLRRAMAAWRRKGGLGPFHERLVGRMVAKGYAREFAERIFSQIQGFGEYGFPESHAASFALLVYASCWLKCHHPDAFAAALLNSQPMGFYAPAQLVRDAREHGVQVRPVCVQASHWDCTLEPVPGEALHALRLGLNRVAGLSVAAGQRVAAARRELEGLGEGSGFASVEDLVRRAALNAKDLEALAAADALRALSGHRRHALWAAKAVDTRPSRLLAQATSVPQSMGTEAAPPALLSPSPGETVVADYRTLGLTLGPHPLALLRSQLLPFRVQPAGVLNTYPHGRLARASGIVTHRQRPETAKGVVFVTLEDETGQVNVVVWPKVVARQRVALMHARLLTVFGQWQREGEVRHLVAVHLIDHTPLLGGLISRSRDFR